MTPKQRWQYLIKQTIEQIGIIDKDTERQEPEPEWWLDMMKIQQLLIEKRAMAETYTIAEREKESREKELLELAVLAFDAIEKNTGARYWSVDDGLKAAFDQFQTLGAGKGLAWLIDSTTGTGMSHLALVYWMEKAMLAMAGRLSDG